MAAPALALVASIEMASASEKDQFDDVERMLLAFERHAD